MGRLRIDRVTWTERALWAVFVAGSVAPLALAPTREEVARQYFDAINRADVEAALVLTTPDVVLRPPLGGQYTGREQARLVLEYRAALHERWRIVGWDFNGQEVHADIEVTNDAWALVGIRPTVSLTLVVREGLLLLEASRSSDRRLRKALDPFLAWAAAVRPVELDRVWQQGQPIRGRDAARRLVGLLREWQAAGVPVAVGTRKGQR